MRPVIHVVLAAAAILAAPAPATAVEKKPVDEAAVLGQIDADAALLVVVRPRGAKAVLDWLGKFGGLAQMSVADVLEDIGRESQQAIGVDLVNPTTWSESGLDLDAPIGMGFLAIDAAAAEKAYKALTADAKRDPKKLAKVARPWYRNRIVMSVADDGKFKKLLGHLAGNPAFALTDGDAARLATVGGVAGADGKDAAKQGAAMAKALKKAKVAVFGRIEQTFVFVRVDGGFATVDALQPFAADLVPFDWKRDSAALLKQLGRKITKGGAGSVLSTGAGTKLVDADLGMWSEPGRVLDTGKATGWERSLSATAGMTDDAKWKELVAEGNKEVQRCEEFRPLATGGPFTDFAWAFRAEPNAFTISGHWGLRKAFALASALVAADDGLVDLGAATDAVAIGALYLNGLAPIRALPRQGAFSKGMTELGEAQYLCGGAGFFATVFFGWPQAIALWIDDASANDPQFKSIADNIRNIAGAWRQVSFEESNMVGVLLASFTSSPDLAWLETQGGKASTIKVGQRDVTLYAPKAKWEPAVLKTALDAGKVAYGAVWGGNAAVKWFWGKGSPKASAAAGVIGLSRADMPKIFEQLGKAQPMFAPVAPELAKRMGLLTGKLSVDGDILNGALKLEIK